jgi:hypothetical protein
MSRLAEILKQEYQTKGIFAGAASALSKRSKEKMDIRNSLFGGSGLGSIIGRKVFGKGYSAISSDKSKMSNVSEAISSGSNTLLQEVSISSKITAKNTLAMPAMARDMYLMKQNMVKLIKLQGGTPTTKAGDFFSRQSAREAAFENKYSKPTTPTKVEQKKEGGGFLGGLLSILGAVGSVFKSILSPLSSLAGILGGLGLAAAAFGGTVWKILRFLAKTRIGKILGLGALAFGAASAMAGGDESSIDPTEGSPTGESGISGAAIAGGAVATYGVARAAMKAPGLISKTGEAILDARTTPSNITFQNAKQTTRWGRFLAFVERKAPKLFAKIGVKLATAGALAAVPIVGWVGAAVQLGLTLWTAYELYELWKEFTNEDTSETETSTTPSQVPNQPSVANNIVQPLNYGNSPSPMSPNQSQSGMTPSNGQANYNLPKGKSISSNEAIDYLVKKGMTPAQAAGVVGNLLQESTLNSGAHNKGENAYGLAQWRGQRLTDLQNFAAAKGKSIDDVNTQLDFILHELNGKESKAGQMLFASKTADEAAYNFGKYYERPKTVEQSRLSYATQSLAQYKPTGSSNVQLAQGDASGTMDGFEIMAASASAADGRSGYPSGGGTTNNIAVQAPAQQNQNQQVAMNSPAAFDTDLAKLLMSPMSL